MDLSNYSTEDIILSALRSEIDARTVYLKVADEIKNALLKDKLKYIADEEQRHREFVENLFKKQFPEKDLVVPDSTPVPLPEISIEGEDVSLVQVFEGAMEAEKAAVDFYNSFADRFEDDEIKKTLEYFATMEMGHYKLFEVEKDNMERFEDFDTDYPMMHVGP